MSGPGTTCPNVPKHVLGKLPSYDRLIVIEKYWLNLFRKLVSPNWLLEWARILKHIQTLTPRIRFWFRFSYDQKKTCPGGLRKTHKKYKARSTSWKNCPQVGGIIRKFIKHRSNTTFGSPEVSQETQITTQTSKISLQIYPRPPTMTPRTSQIMNRAQLVPQ